MISVFVKNWTQLRVRYIFKAEIGIKLLSKEKNNKRFDIPDERTLNGVNLHEDCKPTPNEFQRKELQESKQVSAAEGSESDDSKNKVQISIDLPASGNHAPKSEQKAELKRAVKLGICAGILIGIAHSFFDATSWYFALYQKFDMVAVEPELIRTWDQTLVRGFPLVLAQSLVDNFFSDIAACIAICMLYAALWWKSRKMLYLCMLLIPAVAYLCLHEKCKNVLPSFNEVFFFGLIVWCIACWLVIEGAFSFLGNKQSKS